jgi:hypothetical protein
MPQVCSTQSLHRPATDLLSVSTKFEEKVEDTCFLWETTALAHAEPLVRWTGDNIS